MGAPIRKVRVLCVDDNQDAAETLALLLELLGFDTRACYDGPSALAVADEFQPDVCLLDINMPLMSGHELAGRLRSGANGRPLLLVAATALSADADRQRSADAGFHHHFAKPVDLSTLVAALTEFTRSRWERSSVNDQ
jgi:CheY-like chemotaxis protein